MLAPTQKVANKMIKANSIGFYWIAEEDEILEAQQVSEQSNLFIQIGNAKLVLSRVMVSRYENNVLICSSKYSS